MHRCLALLAVAAAAYGQKPVIFPGGVVNAASYVAGGQTGKVLSGDSIVSIFGSNLASTERVATGFPLPTTLGGTSVMVDGVPVPIFYVSPRQINIQLSATSSPPSPAPADFTQLTVTTAAGTSDPISLPRGDIGGPFGIFTMDATGCGQGAALNVSADGTVSVNSPPNSASPGDFISVYGTGLGAVSNRPPAGSPALSDPLSRALSPPGATFDLAPPTPPTPLRTNASWAGRAPGLVGVDQVNVRIPETIREGCAVPLTFDTSGQNSQPVTISIRKGGGPCLDPPIAGFGQITWERVMAAGTTPSGASESFTAVFPASPGKQPPPSIQLQAGACRANITEYFGPSCPLPGYRNLDAGTVKIQGPGFGPLEAAPTTVEGQTVYRAALPNGTLRPGSFSVSGAEGSDVGPFESTVRIGSGINITSSFPPGTVISSRRDLVVNWTGGDPDTWVTMRFVKHLKTRDNYSICQAPTSSGTIRLGVISGGFLPGGPGPADVEIIIVVTPDPAQVPTISASGLSLGGQHLWKYTYRFGGLTIQ